MPLLERKHQTKSKWHQIEPKQYELSCVAQRSHGTWP